MSITGRRIIDALKQRIGKYYTLPVPPYGSLQYWEKVYKQLPPHAVFEWGQVTAKDLMTHTYVLKQENQRQKVVISVDSSTTSKTTTLGAALNVNTDSAASSTIILGCGNSAVAEDLVRFYGWKGKLFQVDFVTQLVDQMTARCIDLPNVQVVLDDATDLSSFQDNAVDSVFDKGLLDTIFCADEYDAIVDVMNSVHRVLKPGGVFCILSFSQPDYLLPAVKKGLQHKEHWTNLDVRECFGTIIMYRFEKKIPKPQFSRLKRKGVRERTR